MFGRKLKWNAFEDPSRDHRSVFDDIINCGYSEVNNAYISKDFFKKTYRGFDDLIELVAKESAIEPFLQTAEKDFLTIYREAFSGAPAGYRDCRGKVGKKDTKIYFQFTEEYFDLINRQYGEFLEQHPSIRTFFNYLKLIDERSKIIFNESINQIEKHLPTLRRVMYGNRGGLTVTLKILRYDANHELCTSPHYDKSGLTLVLDNDDLVNDKVVLGPYMEKFDFTKLSAPKRQFEGNSGSTSNLLFPGASLEKAGLSLKPTPHAVLPSRAEYRHAIIAFCLIPNIDTRDIQTTIVNKRELMGALCLRAQEKGLMPPEKYD